MAVLTLKEINATEKGDYRVAEVNKGTPDVGKVTMLPGARIPESGMATHVKEELCFIARGEIVFGTEHGEVTVKEGEFHRLDKAVPHFCRNDSGRDVHFVYIMI